MIHKHRGNRRLVRAKKAQHKLDILHQYWGFSDNTIPSYGILDKAKVTSCGVMNPRKMKIKASNSKRYKTPAELRADDRFSDQLNAIYVDDVESNEVETVGV